ncbi:hypothetical protein AKJ18_28755, partial [Vibrio xuii]
MGWAKIKTIIIIVLVILVSEGIRIYTGVPITILDVVILPITCSLVYLMKYYKFPFSKTYKDRQSHQTQNAFQLIGSLVFTAILAVMGTWVAWLGIQAPLQYSSGVKVAA